MYIPSFWDKDRNYIKTSKQGKEVKAWGIQKLGPERHKTKRTSRLTQVPNLSAYNDKPEQGN